MLKFRGRNQSLSFHRSYCSFHDSELERSVLDLSPMEISFIVCSEFTPPLVHTAENFFASQSSWGRFRVSVHSEQRSLQRTAACSAIDS